MTDSTKTSSEKKASNLWTIVALLALVILLTVSYKLKDLLKPGVTLSAEVDPSCDLRSGACTLNLPTGGKVSFVISPNDIPILRPLELQVQTQGVEVSGVEVDFVGVDMEMGYNRSKLEAKDSNHYMGKAVLPVCVRSKMEWEARVLLQTREGLIMAPFRFYTLK